MAKKKEAIAITISVCSGDSCRDRKSKKTRKRLDALVAKKELEGVVTVRKCSCLGDCKNGPVVAVSPGHTRFTGVKPKRAKKVLKKILA